MLHSGMVLAAPQSGSGKTTITCALLAAMKNRKLAVRAFKSGPDYIDPMFHRQVIGVPSRNLDTFFSGADQIRELYGYDRESFSYSVIEGAMGLYDGLGGTQKEGSAYHLAQTLDLPVVLVLDARGMGRTMVALLAGMLQYDRDHRIIGVILNRTSEGFCRTMTPVIEKELGLPVLGCFPVQKSLHLESRHLGLVTAGEIGTLETIVARLAEQAEESLDLDGLLAIARSALSLQFEPLDIKPLGNVKIAVAQDKAFCFYYQDSLDLLSMMGAEIVPFSPLQDAKLPECDGVFLGGGYPELYAKQLSENAALLAELREKLAAGLPCYAECGGFMYLMEGYRDNGTLYPWVGAVQGTCWMTDRLVRFGYVKMTANTDNVMCKAGDSIHAHEFHYSDSDQNGDSFTAQKAGKTLSWPAAQANGTLYAGYPHLHLWGNTGFAENFVKACIRYRQEHSVQ